MNYTKITAALLCTAMLAGSASALEVSMDNYYEVAKENSTTIKSNDKISSATTQDNNESIFTMTGAQYLQKKLTDMQTDQKNATVPYQFGNSLGSYYSTQYKYYELLDSIGTLERNRNLMLTMVKLGMQSDLQELELENSYNQLVNSKLSMESGLAVLKSNLALELGVAVDDLQIDQFVGYDDAELAAMRPTLEAKYNKTEAMKQNHTLNILKYQRTLMGSHVGQAMDIQVNNTVSTMEIGYDNQYADMMNKYDAALIARQILAKQQAEFLITNKQYHLGMISQLDYDAATAQQAMNTQDVFEADLALRIAIVKMDAWNGGIVLSSAG